MGKSYEAAIVKTEPKKSYESAIVGNKMGMDEVMDPGYLAESAEDMVVPAIQGATLQYGDDALRLVNKDAGDKLQEAQTEAQKRSPWAAFGGETLGEYANPLTRVSGKARNFALAIAKSIGSSNPTEMITDTPEQRGERLKKGIVKAGTAGATSLAADVTMGFLSRPFKLPADVKRAKVLGAGVTEFGETGINNREKIARQLKEKGFFSNRPVEFDTKTMKFVPSKDKANKLLLEKPTAEKLLGRASGAQKRLHDEQIAILDDARKKGALVPVEDVIAQLEERAADWISKGGKAVKKDVRAQKISDELESLYGDLIGMMRGKKGEDLALEPEDVMHWVNEGMPPGIKLYIDPVDLAGWKSGLQAQATFGKDSLLKDIPDMDEFYSDLSHNMNEVIFKHVPDKRLQANGMSQHELLVAMKDLKNKVRKQKGTGLDSPPSLLAGGGSTGRMEAIAAEELGGDDAGMLFRANLQDGANKMMNNPTGLDIVDGMLSPILKHIPGMSKQLMHGVPREIGKPPMQERKQGPSASFRIPRNSSKFLEFGPQIIEKLSQVDPNMANMVQQTIAHNPDNIPDIVQELSQKIPQLFDKDPYNRVDGKIMDQTSKMKAIGDTMARLGLSNTQKIKIIDDLNVTGVFPDFPSQGA